MENIRTSDCSLKLSKVQLIYSSKSSYVYKTSLATASKSALINNMESLRHDSIGSRAAESNDVAALRSFGLHINILSPGNYKIIIIIAFTLLCVVLFDFNLVSKAQLQNNIFLRIIFFKDLLF